MGRGDACMLLWRILAGALLTSAGWMAGQHAAGRFDIHLEMLQALQEIRLRLEEGLRRNEELPTTLMRMHQNPLGTVMADAGRQMEKEEPTAEFWFLIFRNLSGLDEEDKSRISGFLAEYAKGGRLLREAELTEMGHYLDRKVKRVQEEKSGCGRLYRNLGVMLGLAAAIMLI